MKEKLLRLCKRLKKCSLNDLTQFLEIDENQTKDILSEYIQNGNIKEINGNYVFIENEIPKIESHHLHSMLEYKTDEEVDLIIRCFCANIAAIKTSLLAKSCENCVDKYYDVFRAFIFNRQLKELDSYYCKSPQKAKYRMFFDKKAYFYIYDNRVFVNDKKLYGKNEQICSKVEKTEFKKINCYLQRIESHNRNSINLKYKLAEALWRRGQNFETLYKDLKNNIL